jgi:hypothetical protein
MNDEEFAREAFAAAFRSGSTGEPPTLPDVEGLAFRGRRAARHRQGAFAAGTTALAGVVTAGVVTGPTLLGIGNSSPSNVSVGAGAPASPAPPSSSAPDPAKPSPGVACATPPTIDWASVLSSALPAGVTATADHSANCVQLADGTRNVEALFKLSTGDVGLQVNVGTGPEIARKLSGGEVKIGPDVSPAAGEGTTSQDPATISKLEAAKRAGAPLPPAAVTSSSPSPSLDAATIAGLEAKKRALASAAASDSPSPNASGAAGIKAGPAGSCSKVGPDENACVSHLTKDSASVVDVQILRTGASPLVVDVAASNGKNLATAAPGQLPSDATMLAIAQAVVAHF